MEAVQALTGSLIMGAGIAAMHYICMAAMRLAAVRQYDARLVTVSVLVAIVISLAALWSAFHFRHDTESGGWRKIGSAMALGAAIPVIHYTGMAAARFIPSGVPPDLSRALSISSLGTAGIAIVTMIVLGIALLTSWVDRRFAAQALQLHRSNERYRQLFERSLAGVYRTTLGGRILDCNDACARILGYGSRRECTSADGRDIYLTCADQGTFVAALSDHKALTNFERRLQRADDATVWVLENAMLFENDDGSGSIVEGTVFDITERKQNESHLREAHAQLEARQREIEEDLRLAARVQQSLAPQSRSWDGGSVVTFYQAVHAIGGDLALVAEGAAGLNVMVCDVSGHGIGSASTRKIEAS
jgi:PAS domain S-box-containing protein